jgi:hypothetical protein
MAMKGIIFWHSIRCWLVWFWGRRKNVYVCRIWGCHSDGLGYTYSPLKVNRRVGGACRPHLHGRRISQARNQHEIASRSLLWFHASRNLWPCKWRRRFRPKVRLTFNGIRGVISQKIGLLGLRFSETSVTFCQTIRRLILESSTHQKYMFVTETDQVP